MPAASGVITCYTLNSINDKVLISGVSAGRNFSIYTICSDVAESLAFTQNFNIVSTANGATQTVDMTDLTQKMTAAYVFYICYSGPTEFTDTSSESPGLTINSGC